MIGFTEPTLADKGRADAILRGLDSRSCDYCFGNLFIWRRRYQYEIAFEEDMLLVRGAFQGRPFYYFPVGRGEKRGAIRRMAAEAAQRKVKFCLAAVTGPMSEELASMFPDSFEFAPDRDGYDYIYRASDLITLKGRKFHAKRNHVTRFRALGNWRYEAITSENIGECAAMDHEWCLQNNCGEDSGLTAEQCAVGQALRHFDGLGFTGGLLRLENRVVAFAIGEPLGKDTFVVHIEKAFGDVEGAYAAINNEFAARNCASFLYVNREDDTGDEGLRKAKLSYQPVILLEKCFASLKEGAAL